MTTPFGLLTLYKNENKTWGNKFIDNLAKDIKLSYPDSTGYSVRNLKYMAKFAETYPEEQIVQEVLAQLTWYHNIALLDKIKDENVSVWYARDTLVSYYPFILQKMD